MPCRASARRRAARRKHCEAREVTTRGHRCGEPASRLLREAGKNRAPRFFVGYAVPYTTFK